MEDFRIGVDAIEDLMAVLDMESYCPALQSVSVERWGYNGNTFDVAHVENNLSIFLSHCHNLQGLTVRMDKIDGYCNNNLTDIVLGVLLEKLRENSLVKISVKTMDMSRNHEINLMITNLLTKHASSLQVLNIPPFDKEGMDCIVSTLIKNQICLKELSIFMGGNPMQMMPSLISYVSSSGGLLEVLEVSSKQVSSNAEDLLASIATSCPKLTHLVTVHGEQSRMETLRQLYEQCPHLEEVSIGSFNKVIETDEKRKYVSMEVKGHNEDWAICLSHALRRRQYKKVTLRLREGYNHRVENLKSMLQPYQIDLIASTTSGASLISLLLDLPHLSSLRLFPEVNNQHTNATLAAISEHANSLTELIFYSNDFSDRLWSELIKTCQLLKRLTVYDCGWESLVAISKLSDLNMVYLRRAESVSEEMLDGLLLSEKVKWSSTLEEGLIRTFEGEFCYNFHNRSRSWIKHVSD
eukprot:scaffold96_cov167-Ochromonas_danica.AAC.20